MLAHSDTILHRSPVLDSTRLDYLASWPSAPVQCHSNSFHVNAISSVYNRVHRFEWNHKCWISRYLHVPPSHARMPDLRLQLADEMTVFIIFDVVWCWNAVRCSVIVWWTHGKKNSTKRTEFEFKFETELRYWAQHKTQTWKMPAREYIAVCLSHAFQSQTRLPTQRWRRRCTYAFAN